MKPLKTLSVTISALLAAWLICELALSFFPRVLAPWNKEMVWDHWAASPDWRSGAVQYNFRYQFDERVGYVRRDVVSASRHFRKDPSAFTAVFIGDSITEPDFSYVSQVGREIAARLPHLPWRGINTGTMGYDTVLEQRLLEAYAIHFQPDLIVLQFCLNDFNSTPLITQDADGRWTAYNAGLLTPWISPHLFGHSKAYRLLATALLWLYEREQPHESRMEKVRAGLMAIEKTARESHVPLRIMIFPYFGVEDPRLADIRQLIAELRLDPITIDLTPSYRGIPGEVLRQSPQDPTHPSVEGHRIAAMALWENLRPLLTEWQNAKRRKGHKLAP